jgi:hypothetical protein
VDLSGSGITTIDYLAFGECTTLTSVSHPTAITIGNAAFVSCTGLLTVTLAAATDIGMGAFTNCVALTTVDLPAATNIGQQAFASCQALTTVDLSAAISIGEYAFGYTGTTEALTVKLGGTAPNLGTALFNGVSGATKSVTVSVPTAQVSSYTSNTIWQDGFKGAGYTSGSAGGGTPNSDISLSISGY